MIKALLIKQEGTKLQISGPVSAKELKGRDDIDLVLLLCDYAETQKVDNKVDIRAFDECTRNSKLSQGASRAMKNVRTITYMLGTVLMEEVKDFYFDSVEYIQ